ncbi:hypothetical protein EG329_008770 [Mollisiaceae sp. DMI_Dod_QoI]|nr:hypothetical protein EG329_008770 [Helotiales sp. DMI_Dod_QoI]
MELPPTTDPSIALAVPDHVSFSRTRYINNKSSFGPANSNSPSLMAAKEGQWIYRSEESIHILDVILRLGALVAIRQDTKNHFIVRIVSEDAGGITIVEPKSFQLQYFTDALNNSDRAKFIVRIKGYVSIKPSDAFSTSCLGVPISPFYTVHFDKISDDYLRVRVPRENLQPESS